MTFVSQAIVSQTKELDLLSQLIGEWSVGIVIKMPYQKILSGCGTMTAKSLDSTLGVSSQIDLHVEDSDDYFEDDLWSFDKNSGKVHVFSLTSQGDVHDHTGNWVDPQNLTVKWTGKYEGKLASEETQLSWVSKDEIRIFETESLEDQTDVTIEYVLKRKASL